MKITPLHDWHIKHGATMSLFGGYDMPLWFQTGAKEEHLAVLKTAGIFDTSHMPPISVSGPDALSLLQIFVTKDLERIGKQKTPLPRGKCTNGAFLNERGGVIDDTIVCLIDENVYLVSINAGMGPVISQHLIKHAGAMDAVVTDLSESVGKIDIQGQQSAKILRNCLQKPDEVFEGMNYFTFKGNFNESSVYADEVRFINGFPVLLSRTGYTGEFGFEIYMDRRHVVTIWEMLLESGKDYGLKPCGLAARDSLRAGAVLPLSHQDIGDWPFINNPWHFALPYNDDRTGFTKDFIGRKALEEVVDSDYTLPFTGFDLRKVSTHDKPAEVYDMKGNRIGIVLTCVTDMGIDRVGEKIYSIASPDAPEGFAPRGLSCGFVRVNSRLDVGEKLVLRDSRRDINVVIADDIRPDRSARRPMKDMLGE